MIRLARERSGLSLRQLARRAQTSHATLSAYEAGRVDPGSRVAERIVRAAGFHVRFELKPEHRTSSGVRAGDELASVLELAEHLPHGTRSRTLSTSRIFPRG
jgi:transcriptional regulator with XRE-family HTH domain